MFCFVFEMMPMKDIRELMNFLKHPSTHNVFSTRSERDNPKTIHIHYSGQRMRMEAKFKLFFAINKEFIFYCLKSQKPFA